jgi:hypothetical protein
MDSKQFGWLYMVEHGQAGCKHNYYGGWDVLPEAVKRYQPLVVSDVDIAAINRIDTADLRQKMLVEVRRVVVDWDKTGDVQSDTVSEFSDTFHDPDTREILRGTLVLLDGTRQDWVSEPVEVTNVFGMMAQLGDAAARFESIFGN